jgi:carboxylesterase
MRGLADHLAKQGFTVLAVRLAGHGGSPDELAAATRTDWLASAEDGLAQLRARCATISLVGFSMGGALAILLAGKHKVANLVTVATPLMLQGDWRLNALAVVRHFVPWYYMLEKANFADPGLREEFGKLYPDLDLSDTTVQATLRREARLSVGAIDELRMLLANARASLSAVRVPTLVMHGRNDVVAPPISAELIIGGINSPRKELTWWDNTGHQMLVSGPHLKDVYRRVARFVAEL